MRALIVLFAVAAVVVLSCMHMWLPEGWQGRCDPRAQGNWSCKGKL